MKKDTMEHWNIVRIVIYHLEINQILVLNNPKRVDKPLNV